MKLNMLLVVAVLLSGAGSAWGEENYLNGHDWPNWNRVAQVSYVLGVWEASANLARGSVINPFAAPGHTVGDVLDAITAFYASPENRSIPIIEVLRIVSRKFQGASAPCIEEITVYHRQIASGVAASILDAQLQRFIKACTVSAAQSLPTTQHK